MLAFLPADSSSHDHVLAKFVGLANEATAIPEQCPGIGDRIGNAPPPDAITRDVEGAEGEALRDAEKLLPTHRPWMTRFGYSLGTFDGCTSLTEQRALNHVS